ncbi:Coenzyme F420-reducing hydrogenase, beta subunit [Fibrobacter sp. UWCM]|uniref:Coenzyme F420 hydrogenase/dehydrogenase, beta subunit C-terminal domain n=1 Tax=Fibrobacter sp. UWCM TaxID=1896208 RepID=UPI0009139174|nr:Coenzyme F420 hydrogenase/dehydrogenase, beta subunit C-terminal domain [Fibrobacter sp. UWCM]SHH69761.1 Coenzyme F420-reducing hydrogenase, beta subunit [Fibrobacter sp. UWCM]
MTIPVAKCSSCGACANACARGAITMQLDKEGFYRPVVDESVCSKCGTCERVCPWTRIVTNPNESSASPKTIAAYVKDEQVRLESSSGGIFSALAERVIEDGGAVVGVAQVAPTRFEQIIVENKADLSKLRGSKYVQANVGMAYKQVRALLLEGRKVLFSGTPCQVAALYSVLGKNHFENLWTIDIVCHGTPSVKVFEKYIHELENKSSATILFSCFRDKREGWRSFSLSSFLKFVSGEGKIHSRNFREDFFLQIFLQNICLNRSCTDCHYGKLPRIADITLGDYWNVADVHPKLDDDKGTSVVLLNTSHGEGLFSSIADCTVRCNSTLEKAIAGNPCIVRSSKENFRRIEFFADLDRFSVEDLVKKYCVPLSLHKIVLLKIRNFMRKCFR